MFLNVKLLRLFILEARALRCDSIMEMIAPAQEHFQKSLSKNIVHRPQVQVKALSCICADDLQTLQSFKMDWSKEEKSPVVR